MATTEVTNTPPQAYKEYIERANLSLIPHQVEGVNWCLKKETVGTVPVPGHPLVRGGLIADEMGLGKTIQILGTIISNPQERTLLVLPRALIEQWSRIIQGTTSLSHYVYHGSKRDISLKRLKSYQIVITTYGLISTYSKAINNPSDPNNKAPTTLHSIEWSRVVYDEAHHIRNKATASYNGAKKLKSDINWLITGTPIQNSIEDFYSLASVMGLRPTFYTVEDNMPIFVKELLLKRTKAEVNLNLPNLVINEIEVPWNNESEKRLAQEIHARLKFSNVETPANAKMSYRLPKSSLPLLMRSKQLCIYPKLTKKNFKESKNVLPVGGSEEASSVNPRPPTDAETERFIDEATGHTSKLSAVLKKIIENKTNGKNKLIFCSYRDEIDYVKSVLDKVGFDAYSFDGRTSQNERESILTNESDKPRVIILQINTGCEGLNLQHYSEIYFISPHWNPSIEDQAIARAYRIGQKSETHVYRFKMAGFDEENKSTTLDEHVMNIQESKREIMKVLNKEEEKGV